MADSWNAWYWADYLRKTAKLTMVQHGAYLLLLAEYYANGPIEANAEVLFRVCRAFTDDEKAAVLLILERYFYIDPEDQKMYRNRRADEEISKSMDIKAKRAVAGKKGQQSLQQKRKQSDSKITAIADTPTPTPTPTVRQPREIPVVSSVSDESFNLDACSQFVMVETGIAGNARLAVVREVISLEMKKGREPKSVAEEMVSAWQKYNVPGRKFKKSVENFYGGGEWRTPESWGGGDKEKRADGFLPPQNVSADYIPESVKRKRELEAAKAANS